ncbi:hypothetical protein OIO90_005035 [Microbotryomycetes sp. JL221]|nr:hypothetical protein OIO90_005035 [Microbotryomycetes sp. JL221]
MASNGTSMQFRTLSSTGLNRRPSAQGYGARQASIDLKDSADASGASTSLLPGHHSGATRARLPRTYRWLRMSAMIGWLLAMLLLVTLVFSHSTMAPEIERVDLGKLVPSRVNMGWNWGNRPGDSSLVDDQAALTGEQKAELAGLDVDDLKSLGHAPGATSGSKLSSDTYQSRVTIVSSFYRITSGKKHRVSEYHEWMTNFLGSVELPIVFYCAPALRSYVQGLRGSKPITIIDDYETPFEMPPLEDLGGREWAVAQNRIDPEKHIHVPDVYGIWTAKPWIVKKASDMNPYRSEYFFWVDAGGFRETAVTHNFQGLSNTLDKLYSELPDDTIVLASTTQPFDVGLDYVTSATRGGHMDRTDRLQGGWYGGKKKGVEWWYRETMKVTVFQAAMQRFAAKEQPVWTQAARLNWRKIYVQNMALRSGPDCGSDMWFAFEQFADGADCEIPAWNGPLYAQELEQQSHNSSKISTKSSKWRYGQSPDRP